MTSSRTTHLRHGKHGSGFAWRGWLAVVAVGVLVLASAPFAVADDFTPQNTAPTVVVDTSTLTFAPDDDSSAATYTIEATVGDVDSLLDLDNVILCLYKQSVNNNVCADANRDPLDTVAMVWTRSSDSFVIDATGGGGDGNDATFFTEQTSVSSYNATNTSMAMDFKFDVSEAMLEGTDWAVKVTATDTSAAATAASDTTGWTVSYYSNVDTARVGQSFGTIATGATADSTDIGATIQANGGTDITYAAADFSDGTTTANLEEASVAGVSPAVTEVALDCSPGATVDTGSDVRVKNAAVDVDPAVFTSGTAEGGSTAETQSCRLHNGGQLPVALYSSTVTVGVTADA